MFCLDLSGGGRNRLKAKGTASPSPVKSSKACLDFVQRQRLRVQVAVRILVCLGLQTVE